MMHEIVYELRIETISVQMILKVMDRTQAVVRESTNIAEVRVQVTLATASAALVTGRIICNELVVIKYFTKGDG